MDVRCNDKRCKYNHDGFCWSEYDITLEVKNGEVVCTDREEIES